MRISLSTRFAGLVIAVLTLVLGSATYVLVVSQRDKFLEVMGGASTIGADLIAMELERAMSRGPDDPIGELDEILAEGAAAAPVRRILLIDDEGRVLRAPAGGAEQGEVLPGVYRTLTEQARQSPYAVGKQAGEGMGFVAVRALPNGEACINCHQGDPSVLGYLAMDVPLSTAWTFVRGQAALMVFSIMVAGALVTILLYGVARRWVILPVDRLRQALTAVEVGVTDVRIESSGAIPELRRVAEAFNAMSDRLSAARRSVERTHAEDHVAADRAISLNTIASVLAHELRNPMAGISMTLSTIARDLPEDHPHQVLIKQAGRQLERVNRELDDLLAYARPPREDAWGDVDLALLARRTTAFARPGARALRVQLKVEILSSEIPAVSGEADRLEQVLLNLIQNAVQAVSESNQAGGRVLVEVRSDQAQHVVVVVEDDGPGISAEVRDRIFEPFYTTRKAGTGLGLPLARRIVDYHGGWLSADRSPGLGGARFTICLPCRDISTEEIAQTGT